MLCGCDPAFGVVLWPACRQQAITPAREGRQRLGALNWDLFRDPREGAQAHKVPGAWGMPRPPRA